MNASRPISLPLLESEPEPERSPLQALLAQARKRLEPPLAVVLGSPRQAALLAGTLAWPDTWCYQLDLYQAGRLRQELGAAAHVRVAVAPDLWDLPGGFAAALYPAAHGGERALKIDMVEQAWHILRPGGTLVVLSSYERDQLFHDQLKKVFGKAHQQSSPEGTVIWASRKESASGSAATPRRRRRHEMTIQVRLGNESLRFLTRPGVFSYGEFDAGARALIETMEVQPGDRVLDLGCGIGANGIAAGRRGAALVHFADSNVRAVALAEHNAGQLGLTNVRGSATDTLADLPPGFDVVLANPPYYAQQAIAHFFIACAQMLLRPGGRLYLVSRQAGAILPMLEETFGTPEPLERRGYVVFRCLAR